MKAKHKKLGLRGRDLSTKWEEKQLNRIPKLMKEKPHDIDMYKLDYVYTTHFIALNKYYLDERREAIRYAQLMIDYTVEYFFGNWRREVPIDDSPPDAHRRKRCEPWTDEFRESIFWASCLGEWGKVKQLAEYPTDECPVGRYEPKLFCIWLLTLAAALRDKSLDNVKDYTEKIDKSRRRYYRLMLNMLQAICEGDSNRFNEQLKLYLNYCNEHTFCRPEIDEKISMDGTFLINFALHKNLNVQVPPEYTDRIVRLKDCDSQVADK